MAGERIIRSIPQPSLVGRDLIIPTATLFDGTENLRLTSASSVACVLAIFARMRRDDGTIAPMQWAHTPTTNRSITTQDYPLGAGVLLNLVIVPTTGAPFVGETFVQAMIVRGSGAGTLPMGILAQDYVTARQPVAWPGATLRRSTDGTGAVRNILTHSQTGAANQTTVPAGARWNVLTCLATLDTTPSAMPARAPQMVFYGADAAIRWITYAANTQPNGVLRRYNVAPGFAPLDYSLSHGMEILSAPQGLSMRAGEIIEWNATNLDALDTLNVNLTVEELLEFA